jgi:hypothetical protein
MTVTWSGIKDYFRKLVGFYIVLLVVFGVMAFAIWYLADQPSYMRDAAVALVSAIAGGLIYDVYKSIFKPILH